MHNMNNLSLHLALIQFVDLSFVRHTFQRILDCKIPTKQNKLSKEQAKLGLYFKFQ